MTREESNIRTGRETADGLDASDMEFYLYNFFLYRCLSNNLVRFGAKKPEI